MTHTGYIDSETTGLEATLGDEMWELAIIMEDHPWRPEWDGEWVFTFPDVSIENADTMALSVGDYYRRMHPFKYGSNPASRLGDVHVSAPCDLRPEDFREPGSGPVTEAWVRDREAAYYIAHLLAKASIVGCRPEFDLPFITKYLRAHGQQPCHDYHTIDVAQVTLGRLRGPADIRRRMRKYRSDDLARDLGVEPPAPEERHTSIGDARWAQRWMKRLEETA